MGFKEEMQSFNINHRMKSINIKGNTINYIISGKAAKKVVLLSAGSGLYEAYYKHIEILEKNYTVLGFDYPYGMKNIDELVENIAEFFKSINFDSSYIIAESAGGLIGQLFLKKYPEMVGGLVLTNTGTITKNIDYTMKKEVQDGIKSTIKTVQMTPAYLLKSALIRKALKKIKEDLGNTVNSVYAKDYVSYFIEKLTKEKVIYLCNMALSFIDKISFNKEDFKDFTGTISIIKTSDDDLFQEEMTQEIKTLFNQTVCREINYGGHASFLFKTKDYVKLLEEVIG